MSARLRGALSGLGCLGVVAAFLLVLGLLALLAELQSPSAVLWTGEHVTGHDKGGVVLYPLHGHELTVIVASEPATTPEHTVTVYVHPGDPTSAMVDDPVVRWLDASLVLAPFDIAAALVALALLRSSRQARRRLTTTGDEFGRGFDVDRWRHERRTPPDPPSAA